MPRQKCIHLHDHTYAYNVYIEEKFEFHTYLCPVNIFLVLVLNDARETINNKRRHL